MFSNRQTNERSCNRRDARAIILRSHLTARGPVIVSPKETVLVSHTIENGIAKTKPI